MKWLLLLSLLINGVLTYQLLQENEVVREEVVEKIVVKRAEPVVVEKKVIVKVPGETNPEPTPAPREFDDKDMEDVVVNVTKDREDFLVGKLGFSDKQFKDVENVKQRFFEKYQKLIPQNMGYLTTKQRKAIIELEEERDAEYARALGDKKWKEWESFRDSYNKKMFKKMIKENGVIVPMEI